LWAERNQTPAAGADLVRPVDRSARYNLFFQQAIDAESFMFRGINLAKLFYDRYTSDVRALDKASRKTRRRVRRRRDPLFSASRVLRLLFLVWMWKVRNKGRPAYVFSGEARISRVNGSAYDLYNPKILESIGRERVLLIEHRVSKAKKSYLPDIYRSDLFLAYRIVSKLCRRLLGRQIKAFYERLRSSNPRLAYDFKEARRIVVHFYSWFLIQKAILRLASPHCALVLCHYDQHAFMAACKMLKIRTIELMHGSILRLHPHYNAPQAPASFRRAFAHSTLPDQIGVYGSFWKENLVTGGLLPDSAVFVLGYYLQTEQPNRTPRVEGKTVLLISTQAPFQRDWLEYVQMLKLSLSPGNWRIIIKPHPNEEDEAYRQIAVPGFVEVSTDSVYALLNQADIHMSVRSTVLFEALRYGVDNYVLVVESAARECQELIDSGVGLPIRQGELPSANAAPSKPASYFFSPFDAALLLRRLASCKGRSE
jgi:hypothetical protein